MQHCHCTSGKFCVPERTISTNRRNRTPLKECSIVTVLRENFASPREQFRTSEELDALGLLQWCYYSSDRGWRPRENNSEQARNWTPLAYCNGVTILRIEDGVPERTIPNKRGIGRPWLIAMVLLFLG